MPPTLLELADDALAALVGPPASRLGQVKHWIYRKAVGSVDEMTDLPRALRERLAPAGVDPLRPLAVRSADGDTTVKWLLDAGGAEIETVLLRYSRRATVCVSSQAGCAMGCPFCATGRDGFQRHLNAGEIVAQVLVAQRHLRAADDRGPDHVTNVVFMGMGEPLANYDNVLSAIHRLTADVGLSARSITVSTIGIPDAIRRLATDAPPVTLALSLHAPDDALRDELVPPNRRWPVAAVLDAVRDYRAAGGRRVTVEYTLIRDVNDSPAQAAALAGLLRPLRVHVNCIPMNPTGDPRHRPPDRARVAAFASAVRAAGVNTTVRQNRGREVDGACGQLRRRPSLDATAEVAH